ncbi:polyol transporter 5-like [Mercurialis annua]|uniref:polyol transporter 5-like n=1 Tax=Mercurialis annua TaxID=3986 RepID=UPI00215DEEF3|nr:polyol transporter 5-like [Mercurialis annua]
MPFVIDSPYWLLFKGRLGKATEAVHKCTATDDSTGQLLSSMRVGMGVPLDPTGDIVDIPQHIRGNIGIVLRGMFFPNSTIHNILLTIVGIHFFQQAAVVGVIFVSVTPHILLSTGHLTTENLTWIEVGIIGFKILMSILLTVSLDRTGRRPLFLVSITSAASLLTALGLSLYFSDFHDFKSLTQKILQLCFLGLFAGAYSCGLAPVAWFYSSEVLLTRLRSLGVSLGIVVNRAVFVILMLMLIPFYYKISFYWIPVVHASALALGFVFSYVYIRGNPISANCGRMLGFTT